MRYHLLLILFSLSIFAQSQIYYVAVGGVASLSTNSLIPGDIIFAFANAPKKSTVYVKAGNYGAINLSVGYDSTTFIGYKNVPGDLLASSVPDSLSTYLSTNYSSTYPILNKNDRVSGGTAILIPKKGVKVMNFLIKNYSTGISASNQFITIENIVLDGFGNPANSYHGWGTVFFGNNNTIKNCFLLNAAAEGFSVKGNNNLITDSKVYANDTTGYAPTDYYFIITMNSSTKDGHFNQIKNCYAERVGNLSHKGHGFCVVGFYIHKSCGTSYCYDASRRYDSVCYNKVEDCVTNNIGEMILLRGINTCYNTFSRVKSLKYGGIYPTWGTKFNNFYNCVVFNSDYGIRYSATTFGDTTDTNVSYTAQSAYPWDLSVCSDGNKFFNCLFNNVTTGISHDSYSEQTNLITSAYIDRINRKIIKNSDYVNCTFVGKEDTTVNTQLFHAMRGNQGNRMINCVVYNFDNFESRYFPSSTSSGAVGAHGIVPTNYVYDHCNFYKNGFNSQIISNGTLTPIPNGYVPGYNNTVGGSFSNCNVLNSGFLNPSQKDYHLTNFPNSGTVDKGTSLPYITSLAYASLNYDLDYNFRPCNPNYDIGAYEYVCSTGINELVQNNKTISIYPNPSSDLVIVHSEKSIISACRLISVEGKLLYLYTGNSNQMVIDASIFSKGMYILEVVTEEGSVMKKWIKN